MKSVDRINFIWGTYMIKFTSSGIEQDWRMKMRFRSNSYSTNRSEILTVKL
jgi:Domain of unknown function (DUF4113)